MSIVAPATDTWAPDLKGCVEFFGSSRGYCQVEALHVDALGRALCTTHARARGVA